MVLNGLQFASMFGRPMRAFGGNAELNQGFSGLGEGLFGRLAGKIDNKYVKGGTELLGQSLSEGLEEVIQTTVQQYATRETLKSTNDADLDSDYFNQETLDSFIAGAIGGGIFTAGGNALNKLTENVNVKKFRAEQIGFVDKALTRTADTFKAAEQVQQEYERAKRAYTSDKSKANVERLVKARRAVKEAQYNSHLSTTINALELDYINGNTNAFDSHINQMQEILDAVESQDLETLKKYNLLDDKGKEKYNNSFVTIKNNFEKNIADSKQIKSMMESNLLNVTSDFESAFDITKKEYLNIKNLEEVSSLNGALNTMYSKDTQFNQLSSDAQKRFKLETELESFNRLEKLSTENKQRQQEIQKELEEIPGYTTKDRRVVNTINVNPYVSAHTSIASIEQAVDDNNAELAGLRNIKNIQSNVKKRKEEAIKNAKTKEEVDAVVKQAEENGVDTPDVKAQAETKKSELAAESTLTQLNPNFENKPAKPKPGSKDITDEDRESENKLNDFLNSGKASSTDTFESPRNFNSDNIPEDVLKQIKDVHNIIADRLDKELGRQSTFQDFINDKIEKTSYENADNMFEAYKFAWKLIGRDISDAQKVYNNTFNTDALSESLLGTYIGEEQVKKENEQVVEEAIKDTSKTAVYDKDNRPVDKDGNYTKDGRTAIPTPKAAHLGVQYTELSPTLKQSTDAILNEAQVGNHYLLDEEFMVEGVVLEVSVPENYQSFKVADWIFVNNAWTKTETTFAEWVAKHNATPGTPKYNNKIPMVAKVDGEDIFFLHDTDWYNQSNIADVENQMEIIKQGKQQISEIRNQVLQGNSQIRINERRFGSIVVLNELKNKIPYMPLSEATGDTTLVVANKFDELSNGNGSVSTKLNLVNNLDKNRFHIGGLYEIRKVNTDEYIALQAILNDPTKGEDLNDTAYNNVKYSILSAVLLRGQNIPSLVKQMELTFGMTISKAKTIQDAIKNTTGIDIQYEIGDYVSMFAKVDKFNSNLVAKLEDNSINEKGNAKYPTGIAYTSIDNNVIKIAVKDGKPVPKSDSGRDSLRGINLNALSDRSVGIVMTILYENFNENTGNFKKSVFDASMKQIGKNKEFISIDSNGSVSTYTGKDGQNTYESFIKDNVRSNVKSFQIKTRDGKTKWITDVQPMIYFELANQAKPITTTAGVAEKAAQEAIEDINNEDLPINEVPDELKDEIKRILRGTEGGEDYLDLFQSRRNFTNKEVQELAEIVDNNITSISPIQQKKLVDSLFNLIIGDVDTSKGTVNLGDIKNRIDNSLNTYLKPEIDKIKAAKEALVKTNNSNLQPVIDKFDEKINQLETILKESDKITSDGKTKSKGDLVRKFERFLSEELSETEDMEENENGEVEFSFNKSSLEKDVKLSFSNNLKMFFANIKKQKKANREDIINFAYLNDFESVDDVISRLTEVMVGLPSSINELITILETKKEDPVYNQILNKIRNTSEEIQNEILYKMIQSKLDMYMVLYSFNREAGTYSLKILNSNSSASDIKIKQQWQSNFINSPLLKTINDERVLNVEPIKKLISDIEEASKLGKLEQKHVPTVKNLLERLGIEVNDNTVQALVERSGSNIFSSSGILGIFKSNLNNILNKNQGKDIIPISDSANNPYENSKGIIDNLVDLEIELNGTRVSKSFRVGSKSIQGAIQKMMVYDVKEQLKDTNSALFQALKEIPYSKRNFILNLLENNDKFRDYFDVSFISLESIKQNKQKVFDDRKINKLSTTDNMLTQYAFFQNRLKELGEVLEGSNLQFRMGHMFNPALSDKEQMILYSTALLDLSYKNFNTASQDISLSEEVLDFMVEQIYSAEFDRIANTYKNPTNIKNYDSAAKRFLSIPALNEMKNSEGANIHDIIKIAANSNEDLNSLRDVFKSQAKEVIKQTVEADVKSKINFADNSGSWFDNGFMVYDREKNSYALNYFDNKYLKSKKGANTGITNQKLAQIAAYDFVVNQYLNQNNTYQLIAGDMALYAPNIKKFTDKQTGKIDNIAFTKAVGESITKRMAMLIAPGNKLANSEGDRYLQIMVNDPVKITSTARELIKQYYGSVSEKNSNLLDRLNQVENSIRNLYNSRKTSDKFEERLGELEASRDSIMSDLADENSDIAGYFAIEGTDAQEYTTWKEHMDILFRQGRLTTEEKNTLESAYNKLSSGEDLNPKELKVVMNPIKPVYAGNVIHRDRNDNPDVNRIVYIKSSSFPLLPQLTRDFKLDKVRRQMEALEAKENKNVRLSYQTANKVGAINTKLTINDLYNIPFEELSESKLKDATLELDRNNFKIQQDTPYKTAKYLKQNKDDMSTMGSQMWKIILGNGINKIEEKIFPNLFGTDIISYINQLEPDNPIIPNNGMLSGRDLDKIKFHAEKMYFDIQRELLYDELGLDKNGFPIDTNESTIALHRLLQKEVTARQYPENVIDNLELIDNNGVLEFVQPLWLSTGANKFESLLQSVISNRLININLPGNGHISASSEGFERITSIEELDTNIKSQIVWLDPNHTGELKTTVVDGNLKESEVLIQSKFRITKMVDGKPKTELIDLTSNKYSRRNPDTGMLELNLDMIDPELLSQFSYRIPTSSHQSGAILKVVGFLPEASGDMLVVPKEHTQQIGEDFDIDKRWVYKSNYIVDKYGYISKLNYENDLEAEKLADLSLALFDNDEINAALDTIQRKKAKIKIKMLENSMIDIYKSVFTSPNNDIQKKVNKILSFDNATDTANIINSRLNSNVDDSNFTLFSDDYQRQQMKLGADGKVGIGIHSNAVTFQAQMERLDNHIIVQEATYDEEGNFSGYLPVYVTIGRYTSDGALGRINTLDGSRTIADVHTENQNSATDNIKAQIMGKRNENTYTMNVLTQLTFRGFDMDRFTRVPGQSQIHIPSLFISQPIIRRYVELMEKNKSITSDFSATARQDIFNQLIQEFDTRKVPNEQKGILTAAEFENASKRMTGDTLYDNLINEDNLKTWDSDIQLAVLKKFMDLEDEAKRIGEFQSLVNSYSTKGLGISYFNVLRNLERLEDLASNGSLDNIQALVGDFIDVDEAETPKYPIEEYIPIPYTKYAVRPTTTEGTVLVNGLVAAVKILDKHFPYKSMLIRSSLEVVKANKLRDLSDSASLDLSYKVISNIRDFFYSDEKLNMFDGDVNTERQRLFFDTKENESLATFMKKLQSSKNPIMLSNELLKSLSFDGIKRDGSPSIIKHEADYNTTFDKTDKYNSFLELLRDDTTDLGMFNNEPMTPRKLAQDLATYAYLANNENGAIGFRDFINVKYLNIIGASEALRDVQKDLNLEYTSNNFIRQFYQHNPDQAFIMSGTNTTIEEFAKVDSKSNDLRNAILSIKDPVKRSAAMSGFLRNLETFTFKEDMGHPATFIAVRNTSVKLTDNQYSLYQWDGTQYVRIPVLGTFGFNEYDTKEPNQISLIKGNPGSDVMYAEKPKDNVPETANPLDAYKLNSVGEAIKQLSEKDNMWGNFAKILAPFVDNTTKIKVQKLFFIKNGFELRTGLYNYGENKIYIDPNILSNIKEDFPEYPVEQIMDEVILEEFIHSITVRQLRQFIKIDEVGDLIPNENAPAFVTKLIKLYELAKQVYPDEYYTSNIEEFIAGVFVSNEFREKLDNQKYAGKTLLQIFKDTLASMLRYLTGASYSDEVINSVYELLKVSNPEVSSPLMDMQQIKQKDKDIDKQLEKVPSNEPTSLTINNDKINYIVNLFKGVKPEYILDVFNDMFNQEGIKGNSKVSYSNSTANFTSRDKNLDIEMNAVTYNTILDSLISKYGENIIDNARNTFDNSLIEDTISRTTYFKKEPPSLEDGLSSGLFTSGGDDYGFRLPEIKKCK